MTEVVWLGDDRADRWEEGIRAAADALAAGRLVVLPTETLYGIACRPDDPEATERLFEAKRRPRGLNLPVLAATAGEAFEVGERTPAAGRLADACWPGPLTMVLRRSDRSRPWSLGDADNTVGLRVPDHRVRRLLERTGPLAVSSANRSGAAPSRDPDRIRAAFGDQVAVYLFDAAEAGEQAGGSGDGAASTVVDLTGTEPRILREGRVSAAAIRDLAGGASEAG
jgi:tRNA threonylcarbamoyl adenosine modification protein (Sua5/YciO/YrdC/YwlC family)